MSPRTETERHLTTANQVRFEEIEAPGTYFSNWSGHLLRVPDDGLKPGCSPVISIVGKEKMMVTKLSDDPYIPVSKARLLAADLDLAVNF